MFKIQTQWSGVQEVQGTLKNLERRGVEKIQRKAVSSWAQGVNKAAKARLVKGAGVMTGQTRKAYGWVVRKYGPKMVGLVGARKGFRVAVMKTTNKRVKGPKAVQDAAVAKGEARWHDPAKIDHLIEFGHGGPHPAPPYPHLRPAIDVTGDKPIVKELTQGLIEECGAK